MQMTHSCVIAYSADVDVVWLNFLLKRKLLLNHLVLRLNILVKSENPIEITQEMQILLSLLM